jgi:peptide-methionine (S)-S-oxide reductase
VIFVMTAEERRAAETKKADVAKLIKLPVAVEILDAAKFWPAEDYHQDYAEKNPLRYNYYRWNCGRDRRIEEVWSAVSG